MRAILAIGRCAKCCAACSTKASGPHLSPDEGFLAGVATTARAIGDPRALHLCNAHYAALESLLQRLGAEIHDVAEPQTVKH